tara:strand:- start:97 stop:351 length:255 start_codon:yes stop_codon:yes gene_type:complete
MYCPICFEDKQNTQKLDCEHTFCKKCIDTWLKGHNTCPCCRENTYINGEPVGINTQFIGSGPLSSIFVTLGRLATWNMEHGFVY